MVNYKTSKDLIDNELSNGVVTPIRRVFENANIAYQEIMRDEHFSTDFAVNVAGRLKTYAVYYQFSPKFVTKNFPFEIKSVTMAFKQKRVELRRGNILLTIAKSRDKNILPSPSKYKRKYSLSNFGMNQIQMVLDGDGTATSIQPYYGLIIYDFNDNGLDYVDIVIPDKDYRDIIDRVSLKPKFEVFKQDDIRDDEDRISELISLKGEVLKNIDKGE